MRTRKGRSPVGLTKEAGVAVIKAVVNPRKIFFPLFLYQISFLFSLVLIHFVKIKKKLMQNIILEII